MYDCKIIPDILVLELEPAMSRLLDDLASNKKYQFENKECILEELFGVIGPSDEYMFESELAEAITMLDNLLPPVGNPDEFVINELLPKMERLVCFAWSLLDKNGVFIDGTQPYGFESFLRLHTIVLRKTKTINN